MSDTKYNYKCYELLIVKSHIFSRNEPNIFKQIFGVFCILGVKFIQLPKFLEYHLHSIIHWSCMSGNKGIIRVPIQHLATNQELLCLYQWVIWEMPIFICRTPFATHKKQHISLHILSKNGWVILSHLLWWMVLLINTGVEVWSCSNEWDQFMNRDYRSTFK